MEANDIPWRLGKVVLSNDPVAADATCARLICFEPDRIPFILEASRFLGNSKLAVIDQVGETLHPPNIPFEISADWVHLRPAGVNVERTSGRAAGRRSFDTEQKAAERMD